MEKLNVGTIGFGKMGLLHTGIFNNLECTRITAITEKKKLISVLMKKYLSGINVYQDYQDMLDKEDLDVVVIATPVFLHKEMIEFAMKKNIHIFVEKPLVKNGVESNSLLQKPYLKKSLVGYNRRFIQTYNLAKKIIDNTLLGNVTFFQSYLFVSQVFTQGQGWMYNPYLSGGGVLIDLGSHAIDLFHYLFGDIEAVQGTSKRIYNKDVEDQVSLDLFLKNVPAGSLQLSWSVEHYRLPECRIDIHCEYGTIIVTEKYITINSERNVDFLKKGLNTYYKQNLTKSVPLDLGGSDYTLEDQHFIDCIMNGSDTRCDFHEAAKTNIVIDSIYSSIANRIRMNITY
jgi:predicted dehydrogenase